MLGIGQIEARIKEVIRPGIGQVVQTQVNTTVSTTSTSFVDLTGMTVTIAPKNKSSKVLIIVSSNVSLSGTNTWWARLQRYYVSGNVTIGGGADGIALGDGGATGVGAQFYTAVYVDSPSTTKAEKYVVQWKVDGNTGVVNGWGDGTGNRVSQSTITAIEVMV